MIQKFSARRVATLLALLTACPALQGSPPPLKTASAAEEAVYRGSCDASAAIAISTNLLVVASDEDSRLRVYRRDQPGLPAQEIDLAPHLALEDRSPETDIEGAARIGDQVYWITSHARNNDGKLRPNRFRFFATEFRVSGDRVEMTFLGSPYKRLLTDLIVAPELRSLNLAAGARRPPKDPGALNIEGLSATPEGRLLIAFRNPVPGGRALIVPLTNPAEVIAGQAARFGAPVLIDLEGLGIRDITYHAGRYLIVGGPFDGGGREKLFSWTGNTEPPRHFKNVKLKGFNPEAVVVYPDKGLHEFQLLSDDSSQRIGRRDCSDVKDPALKQFRSVWVTHEAAAAE